MATTTSTQPSGSRLRTSPDPSVSSRALAKGLEVLDLLSGASEPQSLVELSAALGLGKPSALRLLQTLAMLHYVHKDSNGNYSRGSRLPGAPTSHWVDHLVTLASQEMAQLNYDLAETVSLAALFGDHIRVVQTLESSQNIRMSNYPNRILPPYASSLGKVITAFQPPDQMQILVQVFGVYQITEKTITDPMKIREDLAEVRERGYACEIEETVLGGCCIGAPIIERNGTVRAAVSVSLPFSRLTGRMKQVVPVRVTEAAARISKRLRR